MTQIVFNEIINYLNQEDQRTEQQILDISQKLGKSPQELMQEGYCIIFTPSGQRHFGKVNW